MTVREPAQPVDASTVILVRPGDAGDFECFMVRRHVLSDFASDVYVFPGGKVDETDRDPGLRGAAGDDVEEAPSGMNRERWQGFEVAAIRELFEEAGVLLAYRRDGEIIRLRGQEAQRFEEYRKAMQSGRMTLVDLARREDLVPATDQLHHFAHWITPESFPRRFDTHFFAAELPEDQVPLHDAIETTAGTWVAPREALERYRRGEFPLVFATERNLERLARCDSMDDLVHGTRPEDLKPVIPVVVERDGETVFLGPGDPGYETGG